MARGAVASQMNQQNSNGLLFKLIGANMNSTSDQAFIKNGGFSRYVINQIIADNASTSLTLAAGGIYTGAGKSGVIVVAAAQAWAALISSIINLIPALANSNSRTEAGLFLSLTVAQGSAATCDFYVYGTALS